MIRTRYIFIAAVTIDGKIAKTSRHFSDWTSREDKVYMRKLLDKSDLVVLGNNTYKTARVPLSKRNLFVFTKRYNGAVRKTPSLHMGAPTKAEFKKYIADNNYRTVAVLGGASIYGLFLKWGLVDEMHVTVEPVVFGSGISFFENIKKDMRFRLRQNRQLNKMGSIVLVYTK